MSIKAKKTRLHPELNVSDEVKVMREKATTEKANTSHWPKERFTVKRIEKKFGQNYSYIEGRDRPLLRYELLKD